MDINSVEFYTIAFVVAMSLIGWLMSRSEKKPPSTHIVQLETVPAQDDAQDALTMEITDNGRVLLQRTGLSLGNEETINLVITIQEDHCSIIEKKGINLLLAPGVPLPHALREPVDQRVGHFHL